MGSICVGIYTGNCGDQIVTRQWEGEEPLAKYESIAHTELSMDLSAPVRLPQHTRRNLRAGFTLMELLIVISILGILATLVLMGGARRSLMRGNDARRKSDMARIRSAFEEYFNDKDQFPATTVLDSCKATTLAPYSLAKIPCDPITRKPYLYVPDDTMDLTQGYRVCAKLEDKGDPDITSIGCNPLTGCGWGAKWNYCLASGTTITAAGFVP